MARNSDAWNKDFFDKDKKADLPEGQVFKRDDRRMLKELKSGKEDVNTIKITEHHFKKDK